MPDLKHGHRHARTLERALRRSFQEPFDVTYDDVRAVYRIGLGAAVVEAEPAAVEDHKALHDACRVMATDQLKHQMSLEAHDG